LPVGFREHKGGSDHDRGVAVVPACVHDALVSGSVRPARVFLDGESVHIGPERNGGSLGGVLGGGGKIGQHAGSSGKAASVFDPRFRKLAADNPARSNFGVAELGMGVQIVPNFDDARQAGSDQLIDGGHC